MNLKKPEIYALDRLLLERFGGKAGRGLALRGSRRRETSRRLEFLFEQSLTDCMKDTQASDNHSGRGQNAGGKRLFVVGDVK